MALYYSFFFSKFQITDLNRGLRRMVTGGHSIQHITGLPVNYFFCYCYFLLFFSEFLYLIYLLLLWFYYRIAKNSRREKYIKLEVIKLYIDLGPI